MRLPLSKTQGILLFVLCIFCDIDSDAIPQERVEEVTIDVWYVEKQHFGQVGRAQRWINVLGNIAGIANGEAYFSINGQSKRTLSIGPDQHRLAKQGDFNIELSWSDLNRAYNYLQIVAVTANQVTVKKQVSLLLHEERNWQIPYSVDFSQVQVLIRCIREVRSG